MKKYLLALVVPFVLAGCQQTTKTESQHQEELTAEHEHLVEDGVENEELELNDGERWEINEEMRPFLVGGEELIDTYLNEGQSNFADLESALSHQNNELVQSCTMDGKGHDELHKWLNVHLSLTRNLREAENEEAAVLVAEDIRESYDTFHQYFK